MIVKRMGSNFKLPDGEGVMGKPGSDWVKKFKPPERNVDKEKEEEEGGRRDGGEKKKGGVKRARRVIEDESDEEDDEGGEGGGGELKSSVTFKALKREVVESSISNIMAGLGVEGDKLRENRRRMEGEERGEEWDDEDGDGGEVEAVWEDGEGGEEGGGDVGDGVVEIVYLKWGDDLLDENIK